MDRVAFDCSLGLGDVVVLTAVIRELQLQHPGRFEILPLVQTAYNTLLAGNPHLVPLMRYSQRDEFRIVSCNGMASGFYDFYSHRQHFVHFALSWFSRLLDVPLDVHGAECRGSIYLSPEEQKRKPVAGDYWVMLAGGKRDATVKFYPHWQQVADGLGDLQLVQTGHHADWHPRLDGVPWIDCRSSRDLAILISNSCGVIAPVTAAVHIAGALHKPAVVLAGGYEPAGWLQYPNHIVLNQFTCGAGACFKKWAEPVRHGKPHQECVAKVSGADVLFPQCMFELAPERVIDAVKSLATL